ncbi:MAG TPA: hypothetical protein VGC79_08000, partial [Polyangiaceae bacterium]
MTTVLDDVQQRLEALLDRAEGPGRFVRLWGRSQEPLDLKAEALLALFTELRAGRGSAEATPRALSAAVTELESNLGVLEASSGTREHPPFAYVTWLWRVCESLRQVNTDVLSTRLGQPGDDSRMRTAPLQPLPTGERLQGFAIQPLLELASRETRMLVRRRRLLEAARRVLLESAAALRIPSAEVEPCMQSITFGIQEVTEWQQAGVDPDEDLAHQLRRAVHARDPRAAASLLSILSRLGAREARRPELSWRLWNAHQRLHAGLGVPDQPPTIEQVGERIFGKRAARAVLHGCERARVELGAHVAKASDLVRAAGAVDACFELGRSVAPVRVVEEQRRMAEVRFPTQTMQLRPARSVADLPSSLINDPRLVVHQLATQSLLSRRYRAERKQRAQAVSRHAEARYYLLDGSASMGGWRGCMRDAILLAELSSMIVHLETGTATARPIVYYRYFTTKIESAVKAATIEEALACIESALARQSRGETDIQSALIESFEQIAVERAKDANLQRAQLVLVTDGIAEIDLARVWRARQTLEGMPVRVSVIALGHENPALQRLAATQRARGEPVFYHHVSDRAMLELLGRIRIARPLRDVPTLAVKKPTTAPVTAPEFWHELDELVDELSVLRAPPDLDSMEQSSSL